MVQSHHCVRKIKIMAIQRMGGDNTTDRYKLLETNKSRREVSSARLLVNPMDKKITGVTKMNPIVSALTNRPCWSMDLNFRNR